MRVLFVFLLSALCLAAAPADDPVSDFTVVNVNDSEKDAGISAEERDQVVKQLVDDEATDWDAARAGELRYKRVQLAGAGLNGLFVRSIAKPDCGATGNCSTWLLRKHRATFQLVLNGIAADAVGFQSQMTNRFRNVVASANMSAETSAVSVFQFDGNKYVRRACYEHSRTSTKQIPCK
jgi:hypothetical protein